MKYFLTFIVKSQYYTGFLLLGQIKRLVFFFRISVQDLVKRLQDLEKGALCALRNISAQEALSEWEKEYLGKKSELQQVSKNMKSYSLEEKKELGPLVQNFRKTLESAFAEVEQKVVKEALEARLLNEWLDVTKSVNPSVGAIHPLSQVQRKVERIFSSMGFEIVDGPEVETEWHNFDALNIPSTHPARDMQDTFWISKQSEDSKQNVVLRTHTSSAGQIRALTERGAPLRVICPGKCYRNEATDMTHDAQFYQVEGLLIDKKITLSHLKGTIETLLSELFEKNIKTRFRPGYFPFVEPGLEVDIWYEFIDKQGKERAIWMEFMGCGMTHPKVLEYCGVDPQKYSGFAFGFGLSRLTMLLYGLDDLRFLSSQKQDFLQQFSLTQ